LCFENDMGLIADGETQRRSSGTDGRGRRNRNGAMYRQQHIYATDTKTIIEIISTMSDDSDKRMQREPAVRDGGGHRRAVLRRTATGTDELGVDSADG
jgi:hypothetical protein